MAIYLALHGLRWRILVLAIPVIMFTATVVTGNHYFLDGLLGMIVASTGLGIALALHSRSRRRERQAALADVGVATPPLV
jgi:membrane-associated phospholipid phosphatase